MSRLILLETVPPELSFAPQDTVVALTPNAARRLDEAGVPHRIPSDLGTEQRLRQEEAAFFSETCSWLKRLDDLLMERLPRLGAPELRPATLYAYHWKTLLDNLFARGLELEHLLRQPAQEVLFAPEQAPGASADHFLSFCLSPAGIRTWWVKNLCAQRSLPLRILGQPAEACPRNSASGPAALGRMRRHLLYRGWQIRGFFARPGGSERRLTLLFLESDYLGYLLREALAAGHRCPLADRDWLCASPASDPADWSGAAQLLCAPGSAVWSWSGRWFDAPIASFLGPCLRSWIVRDLRTLAASGPALAGRYDALGVDFVLTPFLTEPIHFSAVAACGLSRKCQSVMIADGDGPELAPAWDLMQLAQTQHYFVPHEEFAEYFRSRRNPAGGRSAQVHVGSERWRTYPRLARRPRLYLQHWEEHWALRWGGPPLPLPDSRPVLLYPLAKPEPDIRRLHRFDYDETWYYRFLKAWIQVLADQQRFFVVLKPLPSPRGGNGTLERLVREQGREHLLISRTPFPRWLPWAERVILDHPSTPMYEAALARVPFRLFLPRNLPLRAEAMQPFASCLERYDSPEEAAEALRRYLSSPHTGTPNLQVNGASILETLPRLREEIFA